MVLSIRRLAGTQYGGSIRQLFLCGTLWIVLAFECCRSRHSGIRRSLVQALTAEPHARFSLNKPTLVTRPREHQIWDDLSMLEHRCFECSPLATTCQDLRWIVSLLEKGCPSVLEFLEEIELRTLFVFQCVAMPTWSIHVRPCPAVLRCHPSFVKVRCDWSIRVASVFNSFALVCLPVFGTLARAG